MGLNIRLTTATTVDLPLVCDPSMRAANPPADDGQDPLALFAQTADPAPLIIPDDASIAKVRPLSRIEIDAAREAAHPPRRADLAAYTRAVEAIANGAERGARATPDADAGAVWIAACEAVDDAMSDADRMAYTRAEKFIMRRLAEIVRRGLVSISDVPAPSIDPARARAIRVAAGWPAAESLPSAGYPVEALLSDVTGADVVRELGQRIEQISTLGKAAGRRSVSQSGESTNTAGDPITTTATGCSVLTSPSTAA